MTIRNVLHFAGCALAASALAAQPPVPAPAPEPERSTPARFSYSPVGARALGLGGAFVAVADDVTAADSNPAGLAQLESTQVLAGLRSASLDTEFSGGLAPAPVTHEDSLRGPAFVGWVHPMGKVTYAGYYQREAECTSEARFVDGPFFIEFSPYNRVDARRYDQRLETLGASAAGRLGPSTSVGVTVRYQRLSVEWEDERSFDFFPHIPQPLAFWGPFIDVRTMADDDETDVTVVVGLLVHPEGRWKGGLSYQQGGDFAPAAQTHFRGFTQSPLLYDLDLELPDVVSAGASFQPRERWLLSAQASHVTYSSLRNLPRAPLPGFGDFFPTSPYFGDDPPDDETQVHLGTEVRVGAAERPLTLRAGAWTDPDHDTVRAIDSDQVHLALGAGKALARGWGLDGAVRIGDTVSEGLLTLSYAF